MVQLEIIELPIDQLNPYIGNAKLHPHLQVDQIAESIEEFGNCDPIGAWTNPDGEIEVVEGHGRLMALKKLGAEKAPVIMLDHLTDEQRKAYALVHNKLTMDTGFDMAILAQELDAIESVDMADYGFELDMGAMDISGLFDEDPVKKGSAEKDNVITVTCECCGEEFDVEL